jgi:Na+/phosphate symporter
MILEAIAAVKVANDAIGAIKELAGNIESIGQIGKHLSNLTDAEDKIKKKADEGDMDAFFELERIRNHKESIKTMFIYQGRPGLWEDWLRFEATRRRLRENERKRQAAKLARKKRIIKETCLTVVLILAILSAVGFIGFLFYWISQQG